MWNVYVQKLLLFCIHDKYKQINRHISSPNFILKVQKNTCFCISSSKKWTFFRGNCIYTDIHRLKVFVVFMIISGEAGCLYYMNFSNRSNDGKNKAAASGWTFYHFLFYGFGHYCLEWNSEVLIFLLTYHSGVFGWYWHVSSNITHNYQ